LTLLIKYAFLTTGGEHMPRYKPNEQDQMMMLPINFAEQILPGTLEYAINDIIDNHTDLSIFDDRYHNDEKGACAYLPAILLKIILYAYSKGILSSRKIEEACKYHIIFKALSGDITPDHSTLADFVSSMKDIILSLFRDILMLCAQLDLIGGEAFALDGCKLSSNAAKEWSGTFEELEKKKKKLEATLKMLMQKHEDNDRNDNEVLDYKTTIEKYKENINKIKEFLSDNDKKVSKRGREMKSNITDNESAKMISPHGMIQGYNGIALVDSKHQIIMHSEAFGQNSEHDFLPTMIEGAKENLENKNMFKEKIVLGDTNYYSEDNFKYLAEEKIDGYIPDTYYRQRDPRFPEKNLHRKTKNLYTKEDFTYLEEENKYLCPTGKKLHYEGKASPHGYKGKKYRTRKNVCSECIKQHRCLRKGSKRRSLFITEEKPVRTHAAKMVEKMDTDEGREIYSMRMGIVEPVFANIRYHKQMNKFTMRTKEKVNVQWLLYSLVHNIEKIANFGWEKYVKQKVPEVDIAKLSYI
jgi:transposase